MTYGIRSTKTDTLTSFLQGVDADIQRSEDTRKSLIVHLRKASESIRKDIEELFQIPKGSSDSIAPVIDIVSKLNDSNLIGSISFEHQGLLVTVQLARTNTDYTPPYSAAMVTRYSGIENQTSNCKVTDVEELGNEFSKLFLGWCKENKDSVRKIRTLVRS